MIRILVFVLALACPSSRCTPVGPQEANDQVNQVQMGVSETAVQDSSSTSIEAMRLGMNLPDLLPRDTSVVFWDVFLQSSRWYPWSGDPTFGIRKRDRQSMKGQPRPKVDEHGWPMLTERQDVFTRMFESTGGHYPGGDYTCTWRGEGKLEFAGDARLGKVTSFKDEKGEVHQATVKVRPGRVGIALVLKGTKSEDYIHDIHLYLPGYESASSPFYEPFLERLEPFGTLRFMNWGATYTNKGVWSERSRVDDCRQTGSYGVAIEWMIDLCNQTDSNAWFCMPHLADDEYVRGFAELVRDRLEPGRKVYVEYSNENWNDIFPEAKWANQTARKRQVKPTQVVAEETSRDFAIWESVLAPSEKGTQAPLDLVRVIGGALHNPGFARGVMGAMETDFDAVAVAPYFGVRPGKDPVDRNSSVKELLDAAYASIDASLMPRLEEHAKLAKAASRRLEHPVQLLVYEGGQTLLARRSTKPGDSRQAFSEKTIQEAQYSDGMGAAYQHLLDRCQEVGVKLFMPFHLCGTHTPASTFGLLEWIDQPLNQSVKYRALLDWLKENK